MVSGTLRILQAAANAKAPAGDIDTVLEQGAPRPTWPSDQTRRIGTVTCGHGCVGRQRLGPVGISKSEPSKGEGGT
jgi:hypothetical protein